MKLNWGEIYIYIYICVYKYDIELAVLHCCLQETYSVRQMKFWELYK